MKNKNTHQRIGKAKTMTPEQERAEQIKNAEAAYKRGEVTADWLAWFRQFTAKAITVIDLRPQADRITK